MSAASNVYLLGGYVTVRTTFSDEEIQGEVFCYDVCTANVLVLKEHRDNGNANFRVIKIPSIKEVIAESRPPERGLRRENGKETGEDGATADSLVPLPACDFAVLERRERRAIEAFQKRQHTIGVGVTREAQDIFDFIHKTHPNCRWDGDTIVVLGVRVTPPYSPDSAAGSDDKRTLDRLKKVIQGFHNRTTQRKKTGSESHTRPVPNPPQRSSNKSMMQDVTDPNARPRYSGAGASGSPSDCGRLQTESITETTRSEEKHVPRGGGVPRKNTAELNAVVSTEPKSTNGGKGSTCLQQDVEQRPPATHYEESANRIANSSDIKESELSGSAPKPLPNSGQAHNEARRPAEPK